MKTNIIRLFSLVVAFLFVSVAESQMRYGKFGIGLSASAYTWQSDLKTSDLGIGASVGLSYSIIEHWSFRSSLGFNSFLGKNAINQDVVTSAFHGNLYVGYDFMPHETFNPFVFAGLGLMYYDPRIKNGNALLAGKDRPWDIVVLGGVGLDYFLDEFWSISVSAEAGVLNADNLDGSAAGGNDLFQRITIGVRYHLFDKDFVSRMIDSFGKRGR